MGNDCPAIDISRAVRNFNPRSHKGNDRASPNICKFWRISIHVPTRGTTRRYMPDPWHRAFQSTFPQGERHYPVFAAISKRLISIHVPTRGTTLPFQCCFSEFRISIHVPTRGTTPSFFDSPHFLQISIHVPTRGTTFNRSTTIFYKPFQSTFPQGERPWYVTVGGTIGIFQSTFPQGERQQIYPNFKRK